MPDYRNKMRELKPARDLFMQELDKGDFSIEVMFQELKQLVPGLKISSLYGWRTIWREAHSNESRGVIVASLKIRNYADERFGEKASTKLISLELEKLFGLKVKMSTVASWKTKWNKTKPVQARPEQVDEKLLGDYEALTTPPASDWALLEQSEGKDFVFPLAEEVVRLLVLAKSNPRIEVLQGKIRSLEAQVKGETILSQELNKSCSDLKGQVAKLEVELEDQRGLNAKLKVLRQNLEG